MNSLPVELPPLLAIETSTAICAVGACVQGEIFEDTRYLERLHNQQALGMIDAVTTAVRQRFGSKFAGFGLVAFGRGPGSFTGVRIGAALAQGVAFAHAAQVLPLASLQVQAEALLEVGGDVSPASGFADQPQACVVLVKSRQQMYYAQAFRRDPPLDLPPGLVPSAWRGLCAPVLLGAHSEWSAWLASLDLGLPLVAPRGTTMVTKLLGAQPDWLQHDPIVEQFVPDIAITAGSALRVSAAAFALGGAVAPQFGLPEYLSADSPWQPSA